MVRLSKDQLRAALAQHMRENIVPLRNMTPAEGRRIAAYSRCVRAFARLRPIRWPGGDPLTSREVCFVLNIKRPAFVKAVATGRLLAKLGPGVRGGYVVARADLEAYLRGLIAEADTLGVAVPAIAYQLAGLRAPRRARAKSA